MFDILIFSCVKKGEWLFVHGGILFVVYLNLQQIEERKNILWIKFKASHMTWMLTSVKLT